MASEPTPKIPHLKPPGAQTPLQKAVKRTLVHRTNGLSSLRKNALAQIARWRVEGVPDREILQRLLLIASDVAHATGNDRIDLVTGEPRWAYVAEALTRIVESQGIAAD